MSATRNAPAHRHTTKTPLESFTLPSYDENGFNLLKSHLKAQQGRLLEMLGRHKYAKYREIIGALEQAIGEIHKRIEDYIKSDPLKLSFEDLAYYFTDLRKINYALTKDVNELIRFITIALPEKTQPIIDAFHRNFYVSLAFSEHQMDDLKFRADQLLKQSLISSSIEIEHTSESAKSVRSHSTTSLSHSNSSSSFEFFSSSNSMKNPKSTTSASDSEVSNLRHCP